MSDRIAELKAYLSDDPRDPFLMFALAQEYQNIGQLEDAYNQYLELQSMHPDYIATYYHIGQLCEALSRPNEAAEFYIQGMEVSQQAGDFRTLSELRAAHRVLADSMD